MTRQSIENLNALLQKKTLTGDPLDSYLNVLKGPISATVTADDPSAYLRSWMARVVTLLMDQQHTASSGTSPYTITVRTPDKTLVANPFIGAIILGLTEYLLLLRNLKGGSKDSVAHDIAKFVPNERLCELIAVCTPVYPVSWSSLYAQVVNRCLIWIFQDMKDLPSTASAKAVNEPESKGAQFAVLQDVIKHLQLIGIQLIQDVWMSQRPSYFFHPVIIAKEMNSAKAIIQGLFNASDAKSQLAEPKSLIGTLPRQRDTDLPTKLIAFSKDIDYGIPLNQSKTMFSPVVPAYMTLAGEVTRVQGQPLRANTISSALRNKLMFNKTVWTALTATGAGLSNLGTSEATSKAYEIITAAIKSSAEDPRSQPKNS